MASIRIPEDTHFTLDILGRYGCNTLDEALDSAVPDRKYADARPFDHIVLGGGSFGAVLATRLFNLDRTHRHRVLVLEAGPFALPEHVQNLPPSFGPPGKGNLGTVWGQPWESDSPMSFNQNFPGLAFCVGGRSVFWGGWSPYFIDSEVADPSWPASVRTDLMTPVLPAANPKESYLDQAARVLGTDKTNDFVTGPLHDALADHFFKTLSNRPGGPGSDDLTGSRGVLNAKDDLEAPLAVAGASERPGFFASNKFSSVQLLLRALRIAQGEAEAASPGDLDRASVFKRLMLVNNCHVTRLRRSGSRITHVVVQPVEYVAQNGTLVRRTLPEKEIELPDGRRVFLALGTIESTRLALNTVPEKPLIGRNFMAHLRSNLTFRVPRSSFAGLDPNQEPDPVKAQKLRELQVSAFFVKGVHTHKDGTSGHYHLQVTASGVGELGMNSEAELFKKIPNIEELDQFKDLTDPWVVVTLRGIGEMVGDKTSPDPENRITLGTPDGNGVPRARVRLETNWSNPSDPRATDPNDQTATKDNELWDAMDAAAEELAASFQALGPVQYLSRPNQPENAHWQAQPPPRNLRRDTLSSTHHEAGTLWMGDQPATSVTDSTGRIWELDNLYAVGPALLPTIGSPNPMLSGVALARRTADKLVAAPAAPPPEPQFSYLFDGTGKTFGRWHKAGPGAFRLQDGLLIAQPGGDHSVLFYAAEAFNDFILRLQFRLPGPVDSFGKAIGNSGVFVRFRYPHTQWPDVNQQEPRAGGNPAWVASATGFEVQIDEQGRDFFFDKHRTGAIYDVPTGQVINGQAEPKDQKYTPGPILQPHRWYEYEIEVVGDTYTVRLGEAQEGQATAFQQVTKFKKPAGKYAVRGLPASAGQSSGYLGVQAHSGPVAFRHIRIGKL
ncbi:MAG TPA: family 16 glycoside hydrolase [Acidimicrobiales bacterium]|nr:family 16 glycoside hydrolase [Acidimicrobiales bacterium]